jgi:RNA polymerase sigma factor (sigma-70 family)
VDAVMTEREIGVVEPVDRDQDLILLAAFRDHGDREALRILFHRHADVAYAAALRLSGNQTDAEDALQEGFLHVIGSVHQFRGEGSVRAWILALVANAQRRQARAAERRHRREQLAARKPEPRERTENEPLLSAVRACLRELPDRYRIPVAMRYLDDLEFSDITAVLGSKEKTVRSLVNRGIERLRKLLRSRGVTATGAGIAAVLSQRDALSMSSQLVEKIDALALSSQHSQATAVAASSLNAFAVAGVACIGLIVAAAVVSFAVTDHSAAAPPAEPPQSGQVEKALAHSVTMDCRYAHVEVAMWLAQESIPIELRIPCAYPKHRFFWRDYLITMNGERTLRQALDGIGEQWCLKWRANRVGVAYFRPDDGRAEGLVTSFRASSNPHEAIVRAQALADTLSYEGVKALVLALNDQPIRATAAAKALGSIDHGRDNLESVLLAFADEEPCREAIRSALSRTDLSSEERDPFLLSCFRAAGAMRLTDAVSVLVERLPVAARDGNALGNAAIQALGFIGDRSATTRIVRLIEQGGQSPTTSAAYRALARLRDPAALQPLRQMLKIDASDSRDCIGALSACGGRDVVPWLDQELRLSEKNFGKGSALVMGIAQIGGPEAIASLRAYAERGVGSHANMEVLALLRDPRDRDAVLTALRAVAKGKHGQREAAQEALATMRDPELLAQLPAMLAAREDSADFSRAHELIECMHCAEAGKLLLKHSAPRNVNRLRSFAVALAASDSDATADYLIRLYDSESGERRRVVARGFTFSNHPKIAHARRKAVLTDSDRNVRETVCEGLGVFPSYGNLFVMLSVMRHERDQSIKNLAKRSTCVRSASEADPRMAQLIEEYLKPETKDAAKLAWPILDIVQQRDR